MFEAGILIEIVKVYQFIMLSAVRKLATLHGEGGLPLGLGPGGCGRVRHAQGQRPGHSRCHSSQLRERC